MVVFRPCAQHLGHASASVGLGLSPPRALPSRRRTGISTSLPQGTATPLMRWDSALLKFTRQVLLPQAFRVILPPMSSELTNCFKNASVASLVGVAELISQTKTIAEYTQNNFEMYTYATLIYLVINLVLIMLMNFLERKYKVPGLMAEGKIRWLSELQNCRRHRPAFGRHRHHAGNRSNAVAGGMVIGTLLALARLSPFKILSLPAKLYVNFFRSVPLLLVLIWFYFAVPMMYNWATGRSAPINVAFVRRGSIYPVEGGLFCRSGARGHTRSFPKGR